MMQNRTIEKLTVATLAGGLLWIALPSMAADGADVPPPLFQIRYIDSGSREKTTSKCIGNPVTPMCAAETWLAIHSYKEGRKLSSIAFGKTPGIENFDYKPDDYGDPSKPEIFTRCYQLIGYWYHHKDDRKLNKNPNYHAGDVALQFRYGYYVEKDGSCDLFQISPSFMGMLMRKGTYGWYVNDLHYGIDYVRSSDYYGDRSR